MSCVIGVLSALGIVNVDILKMALEATAKERGVSFGRSVEDDSGNRYTSWNGMEIIGSLTTNDVSCGIGVAIDKQGKLHFVGDRSSCQTAFDKLKKQIELNYKKITAILACQTLGYEVKVKEKNGITIIEGEER